MSWSGVSGLCGGFQVSSCRHVAWGPLQVSQGFFPRQSLFALPHLRQPQHRRLACTKLLLSDKGKRRNLLQASISWVALRVALFSSLPFTFPSLTSLLPVAKLLTLLSLFFENLPLVSSSVQVVLFGPLQRGDRIACDPCFCLQKSAELFEWRVPDFSCVNVGYAQSFSALIVSSFSSNALVYYATPS